MAGLYFKNGDKKPCHKYKPQMVYHQEQQELGNALVSLSPAPSEYNASLRQNLLASVSDTHATSDRAAPNAAGTSGIAPICWCYSKYGHKSLYIIYICIVVCPKKDLTVVYVLQTELYIGQGSVLNYCTHTMFELH